jgi:hypothetical protein
MGWQDAPVVGQQSTQPQQSKWASAPVVGADQFAGDDLLSNQSMQKLSGGAQSTVTPTPEPSAFAGIKNYGSKINDAFGRLNRAPDTAGLGSLEALGTMLSGGILAPVFGTAESIALGTDPATAHARYTYQPRTESGKAQLGVLGAVASPITDSGTDIALTPLAAELNGVKVPKNAPASNTVRRAVSGPTEEVASARAPVAGTQGPAAQAVRSPGLEGVSEEARAEQYVTGTLKLDWSSIPRDSKASLIRIARDSKNLEKLDPEAVKRQIQLQSLQVPVPATRGVLTRDPVQLRNESNVAATDAGRSIRDTHLDANQALLDNLEVLKGRVANKTGGAQTPEQVGLSVQDQALRQKLTLKKKEVSEKYKAAEDAGELQGKVSPARLLGTIRDSVDKTNYTWVDSWMKANNVVSKTDSGATVTRKLTLAEMESLRQEAVSKAANGGSDAFHAGKIIRAIDETTEGAGGKLYKEARKARKEQALEFEETGAVARLVDNKSRTDRSVALEDTWRKTVIGGSIQDLRNVKRSLLTGGNSSTRNAGKVAWRDIKAQTIEHIQNEATKGVALNERGTPNVTPAAMKRAIDSIGPEKLNEIFGAGTAARLDQILEATRTVKTVPPAIHQGSSTVGNVLAFLERGLGKVPVVGDVGAGAIKAGVKLKEMGEAGRVVRKSKDLPLPKNALATEAPPKKNVLLEY